MNRKIVILSIGVMGNVLAHLGGIVPSLRLPRGYQHPIVWQEYDKESFGINMWTGFSHYEVHEAYDNTHGRTKVPLSVLLFNQDEFTFGQVLANKAVAFGKNLAPIFAAIKPRFSIDRNSVTFGIDAGMRLSDCDDAWSVGLRAQFPYHVTKATLNSCCDVEGVTAEEALNGKLYSCDQETVTSSVGSQLTAQNVCIYRMDLVAALRVDIANVPLLTIDPTNGVEVGNIVATELGTLNAGVPVNIDPGSTTKNANPVHVMVSPDGSLPPRPWGLLVEDAADAQFNKIGPMQVLAANGSNALARGQRLKMQSTVNYNSLLADTNLQKKLFLVPGVVPDNLAIGSATATLVGSGPKTIRDQLNDAIRNSTFSLNGFFADPAINIDFDSQRIVGLGDIDAQLYAGRRWWDCLYTEFWLGLQLPSSKHDKFQQRKILFVPNGSNGHWEFKIGGEANYDASCWLAVRGFAQYAWALGRTEQRNASFLGSNVANLGPQTEAFVSWSYFTGGLHAMVNLPTKYQAGFDIGYELYAKHADKIRFTPLTMNDYTGTVQTLDNDLAAARTKRIGHTIRSEMFCYIKNIQLFGGFSRVVGGKNMPAATDIFLGIDIAY